jgi:hypothetical protein
VTLPRELTSIVRVFIIGLPRVSVNMLAIG